MSNSPLVNYVLLSPNHSGQRKYKIDTITIHHMAGNLSVEACGRVFQPTTREASSNYAVDSQGRVGMYVEEHNRSWCSSSPENDHRAITIEVANDEYGGNWHVSDVALDKTIELCVDICQRNGIERLNYTGDTRGNLTKHEWFAKTNCPGPYLGSQFPYIASEVNKRLGQQKVNPTSNTLYRVRQSWQDKKSQKGAFKDLANAKRCAEQYGLIVFDDNGHQVYPEIKPVQKAVDDIAQEVLNGLWGNGQERKDRLTQAGYDYSVIQNKVNEFVTGSKTSNLKPIEVIAREVMNGEWGNGEERKNRLTNAGYDYQQVQDKVNELCD